MGSPHHTGCLHTRHSHTQKKAKLAVESGHKRAFIVRVIHRKTLSIFIRFLTFCLSRRQSPAGAEFMLALSYPRRQHTNAQRKNLNATDGLNTVSNVHSIHLTSIRQAEIVIHYTLSAIFFSGHTPTHNFPTHRKAK